MHLEILGLIFLSSIVKDRMDFVNCQGTSESPNTNLIPIRNGETKSVLYPTTPYTNLLYNNKVTNESITYRKSGTNVTRKKLKSNKSRKKSKKPLKKSATIAPSIRKMYETNPSTEKKTDINKKRKRTKALRKKTSLSKKPIKISENEESTNVEEMVPDEVDEQYLVETKQKKRPQKSRSHYSDEFDQNLEFEYTRTKTKKRPQTYTNDIPAETAIEEYHAEPARMKIKKKRIKAKAPETAVAKFVDVQSTRPVKTKIHKHRHKSRTKQPEKYATEDTDGEQYIEPIRTKIKKRPYTTLAYEDMLNDYFVTEKSAYDVGPATDETFREDMVDEEYSIKPVKKKKKNRHHKLRTNLFEKFAVNEKLVDQTEGLVRYEEKTEKSITILLDQYPLEKSNKEQSTAYGGKTEKSKTILFEQYSSEKSDKELSTEYGEKTEKSKTILFEQYSSEKSNNEQSTEYGEKTENSKTILLEQNASEKSNKEQSTEYGEKTEKSKTILFEQYSSEKSNNEQSTEYGEKTENSKTILLEQNASEKSNKEQSTEYGEKTEKSKTILFEQYPSEKPAKEQSTEYREKTEKSKTILLEQYASEKPGKEQSIGSIRTNNTEELIKSTPEKSFANEVEEYYINPMKSPQRLTTPAVFEEERPSGPIELLQRSTTPAEIAANEFDQDRTVRPKELLQRSTTPASLNNFDEEQRERTTELFLRSSTPASHETADKEFGEEEHARPIKQHRRPTTPAIEDVYKVKPLRLKKPRRRPTTPATQEPGANEIEVQRPVRPVKLRQRSTTPSSQETGANEIEEQRPVRPVKFRRRSTTPSSQETGANEIEEQRPVRPVKFHRRSTTPSSQETGTNEVNEERPGRPYHRSTTPASDEYTATGNAPYKLSVYSFPKTAPNVYGTYHDPTAAIIRKPPLRSTTPSSDETVRDESNEPFYPMGQNLRSTTPASGESLYPLSQSHHQRLPPPASGESLYPLSQSHHQRLPTPYSGESLYPSSQLHHQRLPTPAPAYPDCYPTILNETYVEPPDCSNVNGHDTTPESNTGKFQNSLYRRIKRLVCDTIRRIILETRGYRFFLFFPIITREIWATTHDIIRIVNRPPYRANFLYCFTRTFIKTKMKQLVSITHDTNKMLYKTFFVWPVVCWNPSNFVPLFWDFAQTSYKAFQLNQRNRQLIISYFEAPKEYLLCLENRKYYKNITSPKDLKYSAETFTYIPTDFWFNDD